MFYFVVYIKFRIYNNHNSLYIYSQICSHKNPQLNHFNDIVLHILYHNIEKNIDNIHNN